MSVHLLLVSMAGVRTVSTDTPVSVIQDGLESTVTSVSEYASALF